jgi:hypothetical protein
MQEGQDNAGTQVGARVAGRLRQGIRKYRGTQEAVQGKAGRTS